MITFLVLFACTGQGPHEGTIVGNPGDAKSKLAPGTGVQFYSAQGALNQVMLMSGGESTEVGLDFIGSLDLLEPFQSVEIPAGMWDSMIVHFDEIQINGDTSDGIQDFEIILSELEITLDGQDSFSIDENDYILELGSPGWLDSALFELIPDIEVFIDEDSDVYGSIVAGVKEETALYVDMDGDGQINTEEREDDNVAYTVSSAQAQDADTAEQTEQDAEDTGESTSKTVTTCGCHDSSVGYLLGPLLAVALIRRRKEED